MIRKPIFLLLHKESVMGFLTVSLYVSTYNVKAQLTDQRIKSADYIIEHRNLLPKPDFSDRSFNLEQLNLSLKEHFGGRLVLPCHLIYLSFS